MLKVIIRTFSLFLLLLIFISGEESSRPQELFSIGLRQRDLVIFSPAHEERQTILRSTYKLRVEAPEYSFLMSFGFNVHGDHAIFIRNDDAQKRALNFIIDRYLIQLSGGSLFTIIFDSYQKKTFGITGHVGEVVVNGRTLPHGEIVVLEFAGFKELLKPKQSDSPRQLTLNANREDSPVVTKETVTIQPDLSIPIAENEATLKIEPKVEKPKTEEIVEVKSVVLEEKKRPSFEKSLIQGFDFEQIQNRVLVRLQQGLELAVKIAQNPKEIPADAFRKVMGENIVKPLLGDQSYQSEADFLFAKESLENENRLIYHRIPQLRKSILQSIQSHSDPSPSLIPMIPKSDLVASKKAASAFNSARYQEAQSLYKSLLMKNTGSLYLLSNLGSVEYLCGNYEGSIDHLEQALALAPYDGYTYGTLAIVKSQHGRVDEAIDEAIAAVALTPEISESYLGLGIILFERGWFGESKKSLEEGLIKNPNSADLHRALAKTLKAMGNQEGEKYKFHYKRSIELGLKKDTNLE